jgi:excisionase family DNA binding protein
MAAIPIQNWSGAMSLKKEVQSQPEIVTPLLVDLRTAAQMLSVSVCEMRKLTRSRKIRHVKHGKKWLVSPDDLRQFVSRELSRSAS